MSTHGTDSVGVVGTSPYQVENLLGGASSRSETCLLLSDDLFCLEFEHVEYDFNNTLIVLLISQIMR